MAPSTASAAVGASVLKALWVFLLEVRLEGLDGVRALALEDLGDVSPGEDDDGVTVLADLLVALAVDVRGGDEDAELPVSQPRDEAAGLPDAHAVAGPVALGLERELHRYGVKAWPEEIVTHSVSPAVTPGAGDVYPVDVGLADLPQVGGELLEVARPVLEVLVDQLQQRRPWRLAAVAAWTG
jgi:hypothetical protein